MRIIRLRYFIKVAECKNFSKAAEEFFIAQSAMSQQIQRLERELDTVLFHRNAKKTELTEEGILFLEDAKKIVTLYDEAVNRLQKFKEGEAKKLNIAYIGMYERAILPELLHEFTENHPLVELNLIYSTGLKIEDDLRLGRADLAIGLPYDFEEKSAFDTFILDMDTFSVALSPNHPLAKKENLTLEDLSQETIFMVDKKDAPKNYERMEKDFKSFGFTPKKISQVESFDTLLLMVESGVGAAFVPSNVAKINSLNLKLYPLKNWGIHLTHHIAAVFRREHQNSNITYFLKEAEAYLKQKRTPNE